MFWTSSVDVQGNFVTLRAPIALYVLLLVLNINPISNPNISVTAANIRLFLPDLYEKNFRVKITKFLLTGERVLEIFSYILLASKFTSRIILPNLLL
jgi:hypothetical protein